MDLANVGLDVTSSGGGAPEGQGGNAAPDLGLFGLFVALEAQFHGGTCGCSGCCGYEYDLSEDGLSYDRVDLSDAEPVSIHRFASPLSSSAPGGAATVNGGGIDFTLTIADLTGEAGEFIEGVRMTMEAVFATLSQFIDGMGVLDIEIEIDDLDDPDEPGFTLASAGPNTFRFTGRENGLDVFTPGSIIELSSGFDPNGSAPDGGITINLGFLENAFIDADVQETDTVPGGSIDLFSVLLHEMFHILGFIGFRDAETFEPDEGDGSNFDVFIDFDEDGLPIFTGPNAVAVYGAPVPLESTRDEGSNLYHIGDEPTDNAATQRTDLDNALTSSAASFGDREIIGALELAILRDLGLDTTIPEGRPIIDFLDRGVFPDLDVAAPVIGGGRIVVFEEEGGVDLTFLRDGLANGLPSVGFELLSGSATAGEDFVPQRDRFVFVPQTLEGPVRLDIIDDDVFDGGETLTLRLFNPANSFLEDEAQFQDFEIVIIDADAPVGVRDGQDVLRFFDIEEGVHVFILDAAEQDAFFADPSRFFFEGVGFETLAAGDEGASAVFSFTDAATGARFLTIDAAEAAAFQAENPDFTPTEGPQIFASDEFLSGTAPVFRFFNTVTGGYFYTQNAAEAEFVRLNLPGFDDQGVAFFAPVDVADVLRFFDLDRGVHVFTTDIAQQNQLASQPDRFFFEGVGFASLDATAAGAQAVLAFTNPADGASFFTLDEDEAEAFLLANPNFVPSTGAPFFAAAEDTAATAPVLRFFNTVTGAYLYTQDETEIAFIRSDLPEFIDQGMAFFAPDVPPSGFAEGDDDAETPSTFGPLEDMIL